MKYIRYEDLSEVEAFRLGIEPIPDWFMDKITSNNIILHDNPFALIKTEAYIKTALGLKVILGGDMVVKDANNCITSCKKHDFNKLYTNNIQYAKEIKRDGYKAINLVTKYSLAELKEALNKQEIKNVDYSKMELYGPICPNCNKSINIFKSTYCSNCGQKLNWR